MSNVDIFFSFQFLFEFLFECYLNNTKKGIIPVAQSKSGTLVLMMGSKAKWFSF